MRGRPQGRSEAEGAPTQKRWPCHRTCAGKEASATDLPKRKQIRLPDYDYSTPAAYFVTVCTVGRRCILSDITVGDGVLDVPNVRLSPYGEILAETLREIENTYSWLSLDHYVIMPNHIHLLLRLGDNGPSGTPAPTNETLPMLISTFKRFANRRCGIQLWQRSYHEHVIRNKDDYRQIWEYIEKNPARWVEDRYYIEGEHSSEGNSID